MENKVLYITIFVLRRMSFADLLTLPNKSLMENFVFCAVAVCKCYTEKLFSKTVKTLTKMSVAEFFLKLEA